MENFLSTYRFQLHKDFRFADLEKLIPYLKKMGISTIYASPVFKAVKGSQHGYDVLDPNEINPELGTEKEFKDLIAITRQEGISWMQDIVPNHMGYFPENPWILDILEKGRFSIYAHYFDISWNDESWNGKLMLPFLGKDPMEAVSGNEIRIVYQNKRISLVYFDSAYPVQPGTYSKILQKCARKTASMDQYILQLNDLHHTEDKNIFHNSWDELLVQFQSIIQNEISGPVVRNEFEKINSDPGYLLSILGDQHYRLCHWQETDSRINYRRFFTVNSLICLNIHDDDVREHHHQLIFSLVKDGLIQGLRIDHIDGLRDPLHYLQSLRNKMGQPYLVVEKILEEGEPFPSEWPVQGSTGYDFLSLVNNLLTLKSNEESFTRFYNGLIDDHRSIYQQVRDKKSLILNHSMGGELENLVNSLLNSGLIRERDPIKKEDLKIVIAEFLVHCPVYRYYGNRLPLESEEENAIRKVFQQVKSSRPELFETTGLMEDLLLNYEGRDEVSRRLILDFYQRCMQYTGPLMAKGVEDTLMYTYNRFISHNEVGDSPGSFGISPREFHRSMLERQKFWPHTMNATSTHDTKRGEDARARLNVLSQVPQDWFTTVEGWMQKNKIYKTSGFPDANDEYFILQTIIATWPPGNFEMDEYRNRLQEYFTKAFREAKRFSSWTKINHAYEASVKDYVNSLLNEENEFPGLVTNFIEKIKDHGFINSLSQLVLKFTCPGIPDIYQGCELWQFSLVDPDNRRPVDFELRKNYLDDIKNNNNSEVLLNQLWQERNSGSIKLWFTHKLLAIRKSHPMLFSNGEYLPLKAEGKYKDHVFAFARKFRNEIIVVCIPLHTFIISKKQQKEIYAFDWEDTRLILPSDFTGDCQNLITDRSIPGLHEFSLNKAGSFPIIILKSTRKENERGAGILLHISSLPGSFGIGDMGPASFDFVDKLSFANQRIWQILPLNPVDENQGYSPYSSPSSFAGNILLISPEILAEQNLLEKDELNKYILPDTAKADFKKALNIKTELLWKAYTIYKSGNFESLKKAHDIFCEEQNYWLEDFQLYCTLKKINDDKPWYEWPGEYAFREKSTLERIQKEQQEYIDWIGFTQFIFHQQWQSLKKYSNKNGIRIMGDLPFYCGYDSSEAWSNPGLFKINQEGSAMAIAGVPPDAFSESGQLWGMPVYNWPAHKESNYQWWMERLKRNLELFDLLRLDHFRAFEAYWEIDAGETTAKNGKWVKAPGADFFNVIKQQLKDLPFVAEDLGEITPEVCSLRDQFSFPGMKVLQFAFGENYSRSEHIPHLHEKSFIVYTGTHDNNTLTGWLNTEAGDETIKRIQKYTGRKVDNEELADLICNLAYSSVANTVILPIQDVLHLDENSRMNIPSLPENNWTWRLLPGQLKIQNFEKIKEWTWLYNRD